MTRTLNDLGGEVLGSAAEGVRPVCNDFRKPEVGDFNVATSGQQEIFRLEITVNHSQSMEIFKSKGHLSSIKACSGISEAHRAP